MSTAITTTLLYNAITLPPKYALLAFEDRCFPPSNANKRKHVSEIPTTELKEHKRDVLLATIVSCIGAPIIEECLFRGALPWLITSTTGIPEEISLIISGVAFSAMHYPNRNSVLDVMNTFVDSYFLYNPLKSSGGLMSSIIGHATHNLIQFLPTLGRTFLPTTSST